MTRDELSRGDRVWRWWNAGTHSDMQVLTVTRVNRVTATVQTDQGATFRIPFADIEGRHTED